MMLTKPGQIIYFLEYHRNCTLCLAVSAGITFAPPLLYLSSTPLRVSYIYLARRREMVELVKCPIAFIFFLSSLARVRQVNPEYFL